MTTKKVHIAWTPPKVINSDGNPEDYPHLKEYEVHHNISDYPSPVILPPSSTSSAPDGIELPEGNYHVAIQAVNTEGYKSAKTITKFTVSDSSLYETAKRNYGVSIGGVISSASTITDGTFSISDSDGWSFAGAGAPQVFTSFLPGDPVVTARFEQDCTDIESETFSSMTEDEQAIKSHYILFDYSEANDPWKLIKYEDTVFSANNTLSLGYWWDTGTGDDGTAANANNSFVDKTGNVNVAADSNIVTYTGSGTSTSFISEFVVGDIIYFSSTKAAKVSFIESATSMYIDRSFATAISNSSIKRQGLRIDINYDAVIYTIRNDGGTFKKYAVELDVDTEAGISGRSNALVSLYRASTDDETTTGPATFSGTFTYTFSTGAVTNGTLNGWTATVPTVAPGSYLWVRQATASSTTTSDNIAIGEWSAARVMSASGASLYTWIRYAENADGSVGFVSTYEEGVTTYIGHRYNQTSSDSSGSTYGQYTWSLFEGAPGGTGGTGASLYTWVKYAENATGSVGFTNTYVQGTTKYVGHAYNKTSATESTDRTDYTWSLFEGAGTSGLNQATAYLFQVNNSNSTPPVDPNGDLTYTFATGVVSGSNFNSWTITRPDTSITNPYRWVIAASASSSTATDILESGDWAGAVLDSAEGYQAATVWLYQRNNTKTSPAVPDNNTTYTFSTKVLSGLDDDWSQDIGTSGDYIHVTTAIALAVNSDTSDVIAPGDWSAAVVLSQTADSRQELTIYKESATAITQAPTGGSYNFTTRTFTPPSGWTSYIPTGNHPKYSSNGTASIEGKTGSDTSITWSVPIEISGKIGKGNLTGYVYWQTRQAAAPEGDDLPTATSYNVVTRTFDTLKAGWGIDPPTYQVSSTAATSTNKYWYASFDATENSSGSGTASGDNLDFGTVRQGIGFTNLVTFDSEDDDHGRTEINGGWITTKQIKSKDYTSNSVSGFSDKGVLFNFEAGDSDNVLQTPHLWIQSNGSARFGGDVRIGSGNAVFTADQYGIYLGDETFENAEFSVTPEGDMKALSGSFETTENTGHGISTVKVGACSTIAGYDVALGAISADYAGIGGIGTRVGVAGRATNTTGDYGGTYGENHDAETWGWLGHNYAGAYVQSLRLHGWTASIHGNSSSGWLRYDGTWTTPTGTLPTQSGNNGKFLKTDGTDASWVTAAGTGTVTTANTPVAGDFAKFTTATAIEGRTVAELKADLSLNNVENTALSTGTASRANTLVTQRNFSLTGDVTANAINFNGSASVALSTVLASGSVDIAHLSATGQDDAKFLRGDNTWQSVSGGGGDHYDNDDVDTHLNQSDPTSGYVLSWNGSDYDWVAQSGGGSGDITRVEITAGAGLSGSADTTSGHHSQVLSIDNLGVTNAMMADDAVGIPELSASGTANANTFLCGNNSWATPTDTNTEYTASGSGIALTGLAFSNTGVTSIVAGTNVTISGATGAVTINASGGGGGGLSLGETSTTAYRGDRGKTAYDHSQAAHLALGSSSTTAYRGDRGTTAYDHSQAAHAPSNATDDQTAAEIIALVGTGDGKLTTKDFTAADHTKLDGIAPGATANTGTVTAVTGGIGVASTGGTTPAISIGQAVATTSSVTFAEVTATSDINLKTNIKTIDNALEKVSDMRGVTFNRAEGPSSGVIAQELEKIAPELVKDGKFKSVAYGNLVGYLIEAIKELKDKVEELENGQKLQK